MTVRFRLVPRTLAVLGLVAGLSGGCRSLPPRAGPQPPGAAEVKTADGWRLAERLPPPLIAVGLTTGSQRSSIGAESGVRVFPGPAESQLPPFDLPARATFVADLRPAAAARFLVQVATLGSEAAAQALAQQMRERFGWGCEVHRPSDAGLHQVRVGPWPTRNEAQGARSRLQAAGMAGAWVVEEPGAATAGQVRLMETGRVLPSALVTPIVEGEALTADSQSYRGFIEIRPAVGGGLTVINHLNLEDYLRGVVPNELSPQAFPQLEALKAQAVAARTYAVRNRGQFRSLGYDLCATPSCQVYRGRSTEQAETDRAVAETRGLVAAHKGTPINALYTSTCGGHTEDVENIFEGPAEPYLRGVACVPEASSWKTIRARARKGIDRDVALLEALDVVDPAGKPPGGSAAHLAGLADRLVKALSRSGCPADAGPALESRGGFWLYLVKRVCWLSRARQLITAQDREYLLQVEDRDALRSEDERLAVALLLAEGLLTPENDNTLRPQARIAPHEALALVARLAERMGPPDLLTAEFRDATDRGLTFTRAGTDTTLPLDAELRLFRAVDGVGRPASQVALTAGERIRLVVRKGAVVFVEVEQPRGGSAADRGSRLYRWEVRQTAEEVGRSIARYGDVGVVKDIVPRRYGVSQRVVELSVIGSRGELPLKGLAIRWGLGLKENLFVIDRELGPGGEVQSFVFTGKGWGHGVGLCQVGAAGLAKAGATFEEILKHYYSDIELTRAY
jgi:stage II sporulation protein D